jgi:hypothetical protein
MSRWGDRKWCTKPHMICNMPLKCSILCVDMVFGSLAINELIRALFRCRLRRLHSRKVARSIIMRLLCTGKTRYARMRWSCIQHELASSESRIWSAVNNCKVLLYIGMVTSIDVSAACNSYVMCVFIRTCFSIIMSERLETWRKLPKESIERMDATDEYYITCIL